MMKEGRNRRVVVRLCGLDDLARESCEAGGEIGETTQS